MSSSLFSPLALLSMCFPTTYEAIDYLLLDTHSRTTVVRTGSDCRSLFCYGNPHWIYFTRSCDRCRWCSHVISFIGFGGRCHRSPSPVNETDFCNASASCPFFVLPMPWQTDMRMKNKKPQSYGKLPATTPWQSLSCCITTGVVLVNYASSVVIRMPTRNQNNQVIWKAISKSPAALDVIG